MLAFSLSLCVSSIRGGEAGGGVGGGLSCGGVVLFTLGKTLKTFTPGIIYNAGLLLCHFLPLLRHRPPPPRLCVDDGDAVILFTPPTVDAAEL